MDDRALQVLIPRQLGSIMDGFSLGWNYGAIIKEVCIWIVLKVAQDFTIFKAAAATHVSQFAHRNIMEAFHAHILNLSMDFHRAEPSSELLAALEPSGAFSNIIQELASNLISPLVDLFVATIYLYRTNGGRSVLVVLSDVVKGASSPGNFIGLVSYWSSISDNLTELTTTYKDIREGLVSIEKLIQTFHKQPTIVNGSKQLQIHAGDISFDRVTFSYGGGHIAIRNVTFTVPGGSTVAIVGESGSGKSTLVNLLLRADDMKEGVIKIDDQDIRDVTLSSLREQIGITPQNIEVFDWSVMENVRFGRLEASDEEVIEVCNAVGLHDGIMKFPEKYETRVGERGITLSGGQRQRIGIARVVLKKPKLIVLDEPTSAVDSRTEIRVLKAFRNLCRGHTTLMIAHRLSTIKDADLILVLHDGSIVERGSHAELLEQRGRYSELWSLQTAREAN
ncbi:hypothetical protein H2204_015407 [Knufia peltigerae]|uniref:ABC transporter domain-containing protein n=1 Tax=Knufia peltigerae TaxID=1002370 RepID=A0AA38XBM9_9EURO|nr:hypothetical protein H2204_015407 [Knufia peltigerae]